VVFLKAGNSTEHTGQGNRRLRDAMLDPENEAMLATIV
jgi:hypothetical protein